MNHIQNETFLSLRSGCFWEPPPCLSAAQKAGRIMLRRMISISCIRLSAHATIIMYMTQ